MKLVLATRNPGKTREIKNLLSELSVDILSLADFPDCPIASEPFDNYLENARQKAEITANFCQAWALADDSGLEVAALGGAPGVLSARYAGENVSYEDNYRLVLKNLDHEPEERRGAVFRCCMVLRSPEGVERITEGELAGRITQEPQGEQGFGYDPIFWVPKLEKTLAQISQAEKNQISHRRQALGKMTENIQEILGKTQ